MEINLIGRGKESHLTEDPPDLEIDSGSEMMCRTMARF